MPRYLWRAVDEDGNVLDILVQNRRDTAAAKRFFRKLMKGAGVVPRVVVNDKLASYGTAHREVMPSVESAGRPATDRCRIPPFRADVRTVHARP